MTDTQQECTTAFTVRLNELTENVIAIRHCDLSRYHVKIYTIHVQLYMCISYKLDAFSKFDLLVFYNSILGTIELINP